MSNFHPKTIRHEKKQKTDLYQEEKVSRDCEKIQMLDLANT